MSSDFPGGAFSAERREALAGVIALSLEFRRSRVFINQLEEPEPVSYLYVVSEFFDAMPELGLGGDVILRSLETVTDFLPEWKDFVFFRPGEEADVVLLVSRRSGAFQVVDAFPGLTVKRHGEVLVITARGADGVRPVAMQWWSSSTTGDWGGVAPFVEVEPGVCAVGVPKSATLRFMATFQ